MDVQSFDDLSVITITDAVVDVTNSERIATEIASARGNARNIVLDLHNVQFIDSSGMGKIVFLVKHAKDEDGRVGLCAVNPSVMVLFNLVKLHQIVSIFPDTAEAIRAFSS